MTHYDSTARVPFAKGGKVDKKQIKPKRIILWKGKVKDWPGGQKAKERTGKQDGGRAGFKKGKAVTKADLAKRDLWRKRELKRRSKIGQRKSKWDIKGGISGHPLNPFRIHADAKSTDWHSTRKDVYNRTRDDLKKSKDADVKKVAENFQKMDYKDKKRAKKAKGGKADKNWIQGVNKSIKKRGTKGVCTGKKFGGPTCRPGTKRYNLAKTFKKMARSKHASGGLVRFI